MGKKETFANRLKSHLGDDWAKSQPDFLLDPARAWVLDRSVESLNYYGRDAWRQYLPTRLHMWGHALNSSQAFAVNLFGPARESRVVAKALWNHLAIAKGSPDPDTVLVHFEYSGPEDYCRTRLGEAGQITQIDVAVEARFVAKKPRMQFIEVKLTESEFGSCRGAKMRKNGNPTPQRCADFAAVRSNPDAQCWLQESENRKYWSFLNQSSSAMQLLPDSAGGCPWRGGLYQVMRNWALARAMSVDGFAEEIGIAICVHPDNEVASILDKPVAGKERLVDAFNTMSQSMRLSVLDPRLIIEAQHAAGAPKGWRDYMQTRYLLS